MGLKIIKQPLSRVSNDNFLRTDFSYVNIVENNFSTKTNRRLADYLTFLETGKGIKKTDYSDGESDYVHVVVKNIRYNKLDLSSPLYITYEKGEYFSDFRLKKNDVVVAISSNVGATFVYEGESDINLTLSHYLARIRIDETRVIPKYLAYYLNSELMKKYFRATETGKSQKNLSKWYIRQLPIFFVEDIKIQTEAIEKILPLEEEIKGIIATQESESDIINEVLVEELGLDLKEFEKIKTTKVHSSSLNNFSENIDLRFSSKFHHPSHKYMLDFLNSKTTKRLKDFVSKPIALGKSISPKQYEEATGCHYMSMATIKSWYFDSSEAKEVSNTYEDNNPEKKVAHNDIIIARSGEGSIGKVALITDPDVNAVFADFTMRVRLYSYSQQFAYYYFRSLFIQHLIEHNKKGLGNNTNIFPSQICEFPMLDFSLERQKEIVNKIKSKIEDQHKYTVQIDEKRAKIEKIILTTLDI